MTRAVASVLAAVLLVLLFAWRAVSQPSQGFGPVYDATNQALRVNTVAGAAAGGTSSNFNQAMPTAGTAAGFRTPAGLMASASITNNNALLVEHFGNVTDTALNAIRVNNVGAGGGGTSSNFAAAFPTAGTAIGLRDANGSMASASKTNNNGLLVDLPGTIANTSLNALRTTPRQLYNTTLETTGTMFGARNGSGLMASASVTNTSALLVTLRNTDGSEVAIAQDGTFNAAVGTTGPLVGFRNASGLQASASITNNNGLLVEHYGNVTDTTNNAIRVNLVAGGGTGGTSSNFGTAFPTAGTAAGFRDPLGAMASASVDNTGRQLVTFATPITLNTSQPTLNVRTTSDSTLTATVTQSNGANLNVRTSSDSTLTATVTQTTAANLNATVAGGASATVANTWSVNVLTDTGLPVRVGDDSNKALRVNIVAGAAAGGTSSNFGTAFPTAGTAVGFRDPLGAMASATVDNTGRQIVTFATPVTINGTVSTAPASFSWVNVAKVNNDTVAVNLGNAGAGTQRVAIASDSQGNAGIDQAIGTRMSVGGGRGSGDAKAFVRCDQFASISTANAGNWQLVASASGQNVYVCGYTFVAGTTPVGVKFVSGQTATDKPCTGNSQDITGAMTVAASGGVVNAVSPVPIFNTQANHGLCVNLSNGGQVSGHVTWTRF